jgi:hypothetical protein
MNNMEENKSSAEAPANKNSNNPPFHDNRVYYSVIVILALPTVSYFIQAIVFGTGKQITSVIAYSILPLIYLAGLYYRQVWVGYLMLIMILLSTLSQLAIMHTMHTANMLDSYNFTGIINSISLLAFVMPLFFFRVPYWLAYLIAIFFSIDGIFTLIYVFWSEAPNLSHLPVLK